MRSEIETLKRQTEQLQYSLKSQRERNERIKTLVSNRQASNNSTTFTVKPEQHESIIKEPSMMTVASNILPLPIFTETVDEYVQTVAENDDDEQQQQQQHQITPIETLIDTCKQLAANKEHLTEEEQSLGIAAVESSIQELLQLNSPADGKSKLCQDIYLAVSVYLMSNLSESCSEYAASNINQIGMVLYDYLNKQRSGDISVRFLIIALHALKSSGQYMVVRLLGLLLDRLNHASSRDRADLVSLLSTSESVYGLTLLILEPFDQSFPALCRAIFGVFDLLQAHSGQLIVEHLKGCEELFNKACLRMFGLFDLGTEQEKSELKPSMLSLGRLCKKLNVEKALSAWLRSNSFWPAAEEESWFLQNETTIGREPLWNSISE